MTDATPPRKKSVALSGVVAANTALCTVGRTGNDLHYRGYDILEVAEASEFEEIAHLLVHERLPTAAELEAYRQKLKSLRDLPDEVRDVLEAIPKAAHPMDVLRTGVSMLGCIEPERDQSVGVARDLADRLIASLPGMLLYWYHFAHNGVRIKVESDADSVAAHFLTLLHRRAPPDLWVRAMHTSLVLYAEHELNASTFTARVIAGTGSDLYSCIVGGIGALRGPKHGGANEVALEIQQRYQTPEEAVADIRARLARKEVVIGFGHPVYTVADPRNRVIKDVGGACPRKPAIARCSASPTQSGGDGRREDVREPRLVLRRRLSRHGRADVDVHAAVRDRAHDGLGRARHRATRRRQDHSAERELRGPGEPPLRPARRARLIQCQSFQRVRFISSNALSSPCAAASRRRSAR
jgi:2-methylcitrate synthase